jgi:hypothetical protein
MDSHGNAWLIKNYHGFAIFMALSCRKSPFFNPVKSSAWTLIDRKMMMKIINFQRKRQWIELKLFL